MAILGNPKALSHISRFEENGASAPCCALQILVMPILSRY